MLSNCERGGNMALIINDPKIHDDYTYYVSDHPVRCPHCDGFSGQFTQLRFENDKTFFEFSCTACGEKFFFFLEFDKLQEMLFKHLQGIGGKNKLYEYGFLVKIFLMVREHEHLIRDRRKYVQFYNKLWRKLHRKEKPKKWWQWWLK